MKITPLMQSMAPAFKAGLAMRPQGQNTPQVATMADQVTLRFGQETGATDAGATGEKPKRKPIETYKEPGYEHLATDDPYVMMDTARNPLEGDEDLVFYESPNYPVCGYTGPDGGVKSK
ncbi:MAG: hypothetical protein KC476_03735 [Cyanobacteria bacterium HKST-UBA06]|nr:hypothetical protein [Cyanobacteria bacterium HKST-UBA04]MCA9807044.1 hypothetical protein [Cyanobacteria bacterium HKST-UBA06]